MMESKKKQHYVFQAYLRAWADNDKIFCLREGRVFPANLDRVACERFFYRFQDLTQKEVQLVEDCFKHASQPLKTIQRDFVRIYSLAPKLRNLAGDGANREFVSRLDQLIAQGEEDYHQRIEDDFLVFIRRMLAGDVDFYSNDEQAAKFLYGLSVQFTRTKRVREAALAEIGPSFHGCDVRRVMAILSPLIAMGMGSALYADRKRFKIVLIDNETDAPFITTDQPVVNLQARPATVPDKLEFLYPLSPRRAMLFLELSSRRGDFPLSAVSVNCYNTLMVESSHEQVFSDSEPYLKSIMSAVRMG